MKTIYTSTVLSVLILLSTNALSQSLPFITKWKTDNDGVSCNTCIEIPTRGTGYLYDIDWNNDGTYDDLGVTGNIGHNYEIPGVYEVAIRGEFPSIYFGTLSSQEVKDNEKLLDIIQWGDIPWQNLESAFQDCTFLELTAIDAPDLTEVTSLARMFVRCEALNADLNHWDVSTITDMSSMFNNAVLFNGDISDWDVSRVIDFSWMFRSTSSYSGNLSAWDVSSAMTFSGMFDKARIFNSDISNWQVGNVLVMNWMFRDTDNFNADLNNWDVSELRSTLKMFESAKAFNRDLNRWNVSKVNAMYGMFEDAENFNGDISSWDVSSLTATWRMFKDAISFSGDLSSWDVSLVLDAHEMFSGAENFNADISGWDVGSVWNMESMFEDAISFDQNLEQWNLSSVADRDGFEHLFDNCGMSSGNYEATLLGWGTNSATPDNFILGSENIKYCDETGRNLLIGKGWDIIGDIKLVEQDGCFSSSIEVSNGFGFQIHPNPVVDLLVINSQAKSFDFQVFNANGIVIQAGRTDGQESKLNLQNIEAGLYFLKLFVGDDFLIRRFAKI